ncbi:(d)CMP kinase [Sellimonas catena]|uniref:Cytidylate kinase n=1 Tax=Sellimonas catena TaxID=2994035 RepID=A0A9W6FH42_9FIRM|nr:(d)CMP kinase [Sellimonas catena]GLG89483.1 cytidylate kinase [Sellimonas catena]
MGYQIAIDGPAGAGKSTIAKLVAKRKGFIYVDTGAMYRGLAIHFLNKGISPEDTEGIKKACEDAEITIGYEDGQQQIYLNGENVTGRLREETVGNMASQSSGIAEVRKKLLDLQRELARKENVVMDGRDIGTSVLPDANVKIFLTASVDTRARRRYNELLEKGEACDYEKIAEDIKERDRRDMTREQSPLRQAEDAYLVDSSDMTIDEVVDKIESVCQK